MDFCGIDSAPSTRHAMKGASRVPEQGMVGGAIVDICTYKLRQRQDSSRFTELSVREAVNSRRTLVVDFASPSR